MYIELGNDIINSDQIKTIKRMASGDAWIVLGAKCEGGPDKRLGEMRIKIKAPQLAQLLELLRRDKYYVLG